MTTKSTSTPTSKATRSASPGTRAAATPLPPAAGGEIRYYMRRPGTYGGQPLDREQVMRLTGQPNDEKLERLGYIARLDTVPIACEACGAEFRSHAGLDLHGTKRHTRAEDRRLTMAPRQPGESDYDYDQRESAFRRAAMQQEQDDDADAERNLPPLNWENTQASREADL